ncbi:MAG: hypothetical protein HUJ86_04215, partial [Synergistes sp.]|nr:hypothetical protein [Synergistes sp.]
TLKFSEKRKFISSGGLGTMGFGMGASIGASFGVKGQSVLVTGDGSFGFCAGEYETLARNNDNVKVILINNHSFGWIRVSNSMAFENEPFATEFSDIDYVTIMKGFGLPADRAAKGDDLFDKCSALFAHKGAAFLEVPFDPEDKVVPPVPGWADKAREKGKKNYY